MEDSPNAGTPDGPREPVIIVPTVAHADTASPTDPTKVGADATEKISTRRKISETLGSSARVGRFRQSAAEIRHNLAGEASAQAAYLNLRERLNRERLNRERLSGERLSGERFNGDQLTGEQENLQTPPSESEITHLELPDNAIQNEPAEVPADLTAAAFFDVDNTMVQGASIVHFARGLASHKYFSYADILEFVWAQTKFRITGKENSDDVAQGREKALSFIAGRETSELVSLGEEIYDEFIADKIWAGTRALANMHLAAGQQVWLVTATPVELAQTIAERLGLTGALGTVAESVDGVFTGRLVGDILHGQGKAHAVRHLAIREGLNLKRCTAYSDSHNDVPMLSLVGTAIAINPDADLRDVAKVRGWEIHDYRTARKAAKIGVPAAAALGAVGGGAAVYRHLKK